MNKTVNINLGGIVFTIDENAYEMLRKYLTSIKSYFTEPSVRDEIIGDIEARIAEMFQERLKEKRQVINLQDVEEVINIMGRPEDIAGEDEEMGEESTSGPGSSGSEKKTRSRKRIYRDPDDTVLGGVAAGIAAYLGIDPTILRLVFVGGVLLWGTTFWIYILLWIIIPKAKNAAEKLEMKGEPVTLENIEKKVKEEFDDLKATFSKPGEGGKKADKGRGFIRGAVGVIGDILKFLLRIIGKIIGVVFVLAGLIVLTVLVIALMGTFGLASISMPFVLPYLAPNSTAVMVGMIGLLLLVGIPFFAILFKGLQMLFNVNTRNRALGLGLGAAWIFGLLLTLGSAMFLVNDFKNSYSTEQALNVRTPQSDTLYLDVNRDYERFMEGEDIEFLDHHVYSLEENMILSDNVQLDIVRSRTNDYSLVKMISARGKSRQHAREMAEHIEYHFDQNDSLLLFGNGLTFPLEDGWRNQKVRLELRVPTGKTVFLSSKMIDVIYDVKNTTNTWDGNMVNHHWTMFEEGLTCTDCDNNTTTYDPGDLNIKHYNYHDFDKLDFTGAYKVSVTKGNEYKVDMRGDKSDLKDIEVVADHDELVIESDEEWYDFFRNRNTVYVDITMPELEKASFGGAVDSKISGFKSNRMDIELSGASDSEMDVQVEELGIDLSGASKLKLRGSGELLKVDLSGASKLYAYNFSTDEAVLDLGGACEAQLKVSRRLAVDASGASKIRYKGNPQVTKDLSGACSVKRVD